MFGSEQNDELQELQQTIAKMSQSEQKDMVSFLAEQTQLSAFRSQALGATDLCFDKCKLKAGLKNSDVITSYDRQCGQNCFLRFLESAAFVMKTLNDQ